MDLEQIVNKIEQLKWELDGLKPLKPEYQQKLNWKLRLDWNYNSNHIEGNTLSYSDTELLLKFGKLPEDTGSKDFREFEEMSAHDVAVKQIEELAKEKERTLTEGFIRELNEVILVKNFWKDAITPDGQPARKEIKVGQYKTTPNSVQTATGEIFHYASPEETPALMHDLMNWYKKESDSNTHPLLIASLLHYKFVCIHPFDDGNGRISRLLMNYVLLKYNYPPAIIKSDDKKNYLAALNRADVGDTEAFIRYIGEQLIRSLELSIKAAKGESLEEEGDLDKEIELLKKELKTRQPTTIQRSKLVVGRVIKENIIPFITSFYKEMETFDDLFNEKYIEGRINIVSEEPRSFSWENNNEIILELNRYALPENPSSFVSLIQLNFRWKAFKFNNERAFDATYHLNIRFDEYSYYFENPHDTIRFKLSKGYDQVITDEERNNLIEEAKRSLLYQIKNLSK